MKKKFLLWGLCLTLMTVLIGCGKSEGGKKQAKGEKETVEFWTISLKPTFDEYFDKLIKEFEEENKDITIEWKDYPFDALQNKLLTAISSGQSPDVVNLNTEMILQMGGKGALEDVNKLLSKDAIDNYLPGIYDATKIGDEVLGVPWYTSTSLLFMNKELVEEAGLNPANPPKTMTELREWAVQINEKTGKKGLTVSPEMKMFGNEGLPVISEDGKKALVNSPESIEMVTEYKKLIDSGAAPKEMMDFEKQVQLMATKDVAMTVAGSTFINKLKTTAPDVFEVLTSAPTPLGANEQRLSVTMFLSIPKKSDHKEAAGKFAEFVTNDKNQLEFAKLSNTGPSVAGALEDPYFTESDGSVESDAKMNSAKALHDASEFSVRVLNANDISSAVGKALQNILINDKDVKTELDQAAAEIDAILAK